MYAICLNRGNIKQMRPYKTRWYCTNVTLAAVPLTFQAHGFKQLILYNCKPFKKLWIWTRVRLPTQKHKAATNICTQPTNIQYFGPYQNILLLVLQRVLAHALSNMRIKHHNDIQCEMSSRCHQNQDLHPGQNSETKSTHTHTEQMSKIHQMELRNAMQHWNNNKC